MEQPRFELGIIPICAWVDCHAFRARRRRCCGYSPICPIVASFKHPPLASLPEPTLPPLADHFTGLVAQHFCCR